MLMFPCGLEGDGERDIEDGVDIHWMRFRNIMCVREWLVDACLHDHMKRKFWQILSGTIFVDTPDHSNRNVSRHAGRSNDGPTSVSCTKLDSRLSCTRERCSCINMTHFGL